MDPRHYPGEISPRVLSFVSRNYQINKFVTQGCIASCLLVFAGWTVTEPGSEIAKEVDSYVTWFRSPRRHWIIQKLSRFVPTTTQLRRHLYEYFVFKSDEPRNYLSWIGSAFIHLDLFHLLFNISTFRSFTQMSVLVWLPYYHMTSIIFGSAIVSAGTTLYDARQRNVRKVGLGMSGIVSGVTMAATMLTPWVKVRLMGFVEMPLVVDTAFFFCLDTYLMRQGYYTGVGHAAHIGGAVFGAVYYVVALRSYGGVLAGLL